MSAPAGPGWIAVGDAAATHDPLAADGIVKALDEGIRAAAAIQNPADGPAGYAASLTAAFQQYLKSRTEYYRTEMRWHVAFLASAALRGSTGGRVRTTR